MTKRRTGAPQAQAAAQAGISERSGRQLERDPGWQPAGKRGKRSHRTRPDPFEAVWTSEIVPLLQESPTLLATTILADLQERYPGRYADSTLRTLQRRLRGWRAQHGPEQELFFPQTMEPGQQMLCDFTVMDRLGVTIAGRAFPHRLAHVRLRYSGWAHAEVVLGGESFTALATALKNALELFGGVPQTLRTDSLSAAFGNRERSVADDSRQSFAEFCTHYGLQATRNNRGQCHENGGIESPNGHLKTAIDQALLLRGDRDFASEALYRTFIAEILAKQNARRSAAIGRERPHLQPLPDHEAATYRVCSATVTRNGTISVARCVYSVPSRLRGYHLTVHLFDTHIACYAGTEFVHESRRVHPHGNRRVYSIDYRHVIAALARKPGAFRNLSYRDALHPTESFAAAWQRIDADYDAEQAPRVYLEFLRLAAVHGEAPIEAYFQAACADNQPLDTHACERQLNGSRRTATPTSGNVVRHAQAADYDVLLCQQPASEKSP